MIQKGRIEALRPHLFGPNEGCLYMFGNGDRKVLPFLKLFCLRVFPTAKVVKSHRLMLSLRPMERHHF